MMTDTPYQYSHAPSSQMHRKPLPHLQPERPYPSEPQTVYSHSRTRTTSSNVFPTNSQPYSPQNNTMLQSGYHHTRRNPSTGTFSTVASSGNGPFPIRQSASNNSIDLRRSISSRSGGASQPTSYVALMRKQKATVWCDRAQHEDPRLLAAQRAAKVRAAMEVLGGSTTTGRTAASSGSMVGSNRVTAKIRHHGKAGLVGYTPTENFGVGVGGVPMRLSASEVEGGDSEDEDSTSAKMYHHRSGSGRSSVGSRRGLTYRQSGASGTSGRWSSGNTPPSERERDDSLTDLAEAGETPMPIGHTRAKDYFSAGDGQSAYSAGSGSSGEKRDEVADLTITGAGGNAAARLASNSLLGREKSVRNPEELRRRGSVDERTMTMSAGRLFVANPDMDSD